MISHISYLRKARILLIDLLSNDVIKDELNESISQLKIVLNSGVTIYIRYNEFGEYGYQIIYSPQKDDFSRFDNFDDRWDVATKPHHFHKKGSRIAIASPMLGNPNHDMPILAKYLIEEKI